MFFPRDSNRKDQGSVILELVLAFPLLACVIFTALKFSNELRSYQSLATLSSEAGGRAFRECALISGSQMQTCLTNVATQLNQFAATALPGTNVIVSVYRSSPSGVVSLAGRGGVNSSTQLTPAGYSSRFNPTIVGNRYAFLNANNPVIAIGEVFLRQNQVIPTIPFIYKPAVEVMYDTTVF